MKRILLLLCILYGSVTFSQTKSKPAPATNTELPKISVTLGGYKSGNITSDILTQLVDSSITARDSKGITYPIVRFRILYRFKSSYEDQETGQRKVVGDLRTSDFNNTAKLTELWSQSIKDNVAKGDEITLDNIIVKLKNGTKLMAPPITFKVL